MNRFFLPIFLLGLVLFSSCMHQPANDLGTDSALGLGSQSDAAAAQQELNHIQEAQREEQKRQLDRQINDSVNQPPVVNQ